MGAGIKYDRTRKCYYYAENGGVTISRFMKYGEKLGTDATANIGKPEESCFSEAAIFVKFKNEYDFFHGRKITWKIFNFAIENTL